MLACKWDTDKQSLCSDFRTRKNKTILLARKKKSQHASVYVYSINLGRGMTKNRTILLARKKSQCASGFSKNLGRGYFCNHSNWCESKRLKFNFIQFFLVLNVLKIIIHLLFEFFTGRINYECNKD